MPVPSPRTPADHPDYCINLQQAIELPLMELVDQAVQSGWKQEQIFGAIQEVAKNLALAYAEDPDPSDDAP